MDPFSQQTFWLVKAGKAKVWRITFTMTPFYPVSQQDIFVSAFSLMSSNSSSLSCVSAWNRPEAPEGETDEPEDGQQVGKRGGVHRRDSERGAGLLHTWRPLQSPAFTSVWLPGRGTIACLYSLVHLHKKKQLITYNKRLFHQLNPLISVHQQSHGERSPGD